MDDILAKHLAKTLLFKENNNNDDNYQYRLLDGKYYISKGSDLIVSEKIGYWKNKEVIKVNNENFIILENTNKLIPLKHVSSEEFEQNFTTKPNKIKKSISYKNQLLPVSKKKLLKRNSEESTISSDTVPRISNKTQKEQNTRKRVY
jgi:hypothetical protein